jgi:uncharacterized protein
MTVAPSRRLLPELDARVAADGVRIPPGVTVPLTPRVRALVDTVEVRRLAGISQLGLVSLVYPGAVHSRLEHSLGAYRLALEFLARLEHDERFMATVRPADAATFVVAALLHDVGHWPYCHPIEDMGLAELPRHERLVAEILARGQLGEILRSAWGLDPERVAAVICGTATDPAGRIVQSLLSGPIDVDKMDYLARDSLHAGVPYGRHFDEERLLSSLCLDEAGTALAISDKGRTAAELMVFARYVMFSEVYWHHAVRAATAMLQRGMWLVRDRVDPQRLRGMSDADFAPWFLATTAGTPAARLADGLFGDRRRLFKRAATFDAVHHPDVHRACAGRTYAGAAAVSGRLADLLRERAGIAVDPALLIVDAPPADREVEFRIQVRERPARAGPDARPAWRRLDDLSPVVRSLAREQFDDIVKRVRIFAEPDTAAAVAGCADLEQMLLEAAAAAPA